MADKFGGIVTGRGHASLTAVAAQLASEEVLAEGLLECAAKPTLAAMQRNLEPHRRHHPSAVDSVGIVGLAGQTPGVVAIAVGAIGDNALESGNVLRAPQGEADKGWILRFLEWGTSRQRASPWARPALDETEPRVVPGLVEFLKRKLANVKVR